MILSSGSGPSVGAGVWVPVLLSLALYGVAALQWGAAERWSRLALPAAWLLHLLTLVIDIAGWGMGGSGTRLGFAPVLSMAVWIVIGLHMVESRFLPVPAVRGWLAPAGAVVVALAAAFPGEVRHFASSMGPLHFVLGVGAYGLFGAAVLHGALLDAAERRLRLKGPLPVSQGGLPLLQLERLTFRFVEVGFAVLTAALLLGVFTGVAWRWDHKTVFSMLGWAVFATLLVGRRLQGWRGRRATRWLYTGAFLLLLAYVGSRFVFEVLLGRAPV